MTQKQNLRILLIFALFFVSLGGWLLHLRVHPIDKDWSDYIPFIIGILSTAVIPWLFFSHRWTDLAYILNGMFVILGIILMTHLSVVYVRHWPPDKMLTVGSFFLQTLFPDIMMSVSAFFIGKALFELRITDLARELPIRFKFFRYPNMGWWLVHLVAIAAVYAIGVIFLGGHYGKV